MSSSNAAAGPSRPSKKPKARAPSPSKSVPPQDAAPKMQIPDAALAKIRHHLTVPIEPAHSLASLRISAEKYSIELVDEEVGRYLYHHSLVVWRTIREFLYILLTNRAEGPALSDLVALPELADIAAFVAGVFESWHDLSWSPKEPLYLIPPFVITTLYSAELVARFLRPAVVTFRFQLPQELLELPLNHSLLSLLKPLWCKSHLAYPRFRLYDQLCSTISLNEMFHRTCHANQCIPSIIETFDLPVDHTWIQSLRAGNGFPECELVPRETAHIFPYDHQVSDPHLCAAKKWSELPPCRTPIRGRTLASPQGPLHSVQPDTPGPFSPYLAQVPILPPFYHDFPDQHNREIVLYSYHLPDHAGRLFEGLKFLAQELVPLLIDYLEDNEISDAVQLLANHRVLKMLGRIVAEVTANPKAGSATRVVPFWIPCILLSAEILVRIASNFSGSRLSWYLPDDWVHRSDLNMAEWVKPFWFMNGMPDPLVGVNFPLRIPSQPSIIELIEQFKDDGFAGLQDVAQPWDSNYIRQLRYPSSPARKFPLCLPYISFQRAWYESGVLPASSGAIKPVFLEIPSKFSAPMDVKVSALDSDPDFVPSESGFDPEDVVMEEPADLSEDDHQHPPETDMDAENFETEEPDDDAESEEEEDEEVDQIRESGGTQSPAPSLSQALNSPARRSESPPSAHDPASTFEDVVHNAQKGFSLSVPRLEKADNDTTLRAPPSLYSGVSRQVLDPPLVKPAQYWQQNKDSVMTYRRPGSSAKQAEPVVLHKESGWVCGRRETLHAISLGPTFSALHACDQCITRGIGHRCSPRPGHKCGPCASKVSGPCSHEASPDLVNMMRDQLKPLVGLCPSALGDEVVSLIRQGEITQQLLETAEMARETYFEAYDRLAAKFEDPLVLFNTIRAGGGRVHSADFEKFSQEFNWSIFGMEQVDTVRAAFHEVGPLPSGSEPRERRAWEESLADAMKDPNVIANVPVLQQAWNTFTAKISAEEATRKGRKKTDFVSLRHRTKRKAGISATSQPAAESSSSEDEGAAPPTPEDPRPAKRRRANTKTSTSADVTTSKRQGKQRAVPSRSPSPEFPAPSPPPVAANPKTKKTKGGK
ncbi:hypothetical protein V5O48_017767 [Marasmius crinis-equi]|uniref:Uncharacterized protein n=1 Tax=Marasmius crinis-equi TaxID=585013 RepID=A0ABR3EN23_9AGAR